MRRLLIAFVLVAGSSVAAGAAPRVTDPDWPCQSVKVGQLSVAALWNGPAFDPASTAWRDDPAAAALAAAIAPRRVKLAEAEQRIAGFAQQPNGDRTTALTHLFAGLFSALNGERESVVSGLSRFGARQKVLAEELRGKAEALRAAQTASAPGSDPDPKVAELGQRLAWDTELFEARRASLQVACDLPNVIEQRLGALSRAIQAHLN